MNIKNWDKNLEYLKVNFFLMWKQTIEYKANFITTIFQMSIFMTIHIFGLYLTWFALGDVINWKFEHFLIFYFLGFLVTIISGFFNFAKDFSYEILRGGLNNYLIRPINPYIGYTFSKLSGWAFLSFIVRSLGLIFTLIYFNIDLNNFFLVSILIIMFNLVYFSVCNFIDSTEFIFKKMSDTLWNPYESMYGVVNNFPAPFFNSFKFNYLLFLFPTYLGGLILIPLILGEKILFFKTNLLIISFIIIIFFTLTFINWKHGLRKYEAFG